jgi:hypothetical protein
VVKWSEFLATDPEFRFRFPTLLFFWEGVGLERGPLSLVSTIEELLGRKCSGSGVESQEYGSIDPSCWPRGTLYPQKLALTSLADSGHGVYFMDGLKWSSVYRRMRWRVREMRTCGQRRPHRRKVFRPDRSLQGPVRMWRVGRSLLRQCGVQDGSDDENMIARARTTRNIKMARVEVESKGFWRWCITLRMTVFADFFSNVRNSK